MIALFAALALAAASSPAPRAHAVLAAPKPAARSGLSGAALIRPGAHGVVGGPKVVTLGLDGGRVSRRRGPATP
jgi:hypothetical protein